MSVIQEDIQQKSVALTTKAAKLTAHGLARIMRGALRQMKKGRDAPKMGKQSVQELAKGGTLQNIEISNDNIKAFEPFARKYGVNYSLQRDNSESPPKWLVFFRAKDADTLTVAFKEFSAKVLMKTKERPSVIGSMAKFRELLKNAVRDKTKHKTHGEHEL